MNFRLISCLGLFALASASGPNGGKKPRETNEWLEAVEEFKKLVHAITFGEGVPSHHSNPLQMLIHQVEAESTENNRFGFPSGWIEEREKKGHDNSPKKNPKKQRINNQKTKKHFLSIKQNTPDEVAFVQFLMAAEEPSFRVQNPKKTLNERRRRSLQDSENRFQEIIRARQNRRKAIVERVEARRSKKPEDQKKDTKSSFTAKTEKPKTKDSWKMDGKSLRNTVTLSVAFGVIVTALFCVVVQLFRLFAGSKSGGSGTAFERINRHSAYGYDRIALDVNEDAEEIAPLNPSA